MLTGQALVAASDTQRSRIVKLIEAAYLLGKEELPFSKFSSIVNLEKLHGVDLGTTYLNRLAAKAFTMSIGHVMIESVKEELKQALYVSLMTDGSTDASVKEKELVFVRFIRHDGSCCMRLLGLRDIASATAAGLVTVVTKVCDDMGLKYKSQLVGFMADGASVNFGVKSGVIAMLRRDVPWLVGIHCLSHRLELALKSAFSGTYMDELCELLISLYYLYHNSPKRMRGLEDLAKVMDVNIRKPVRAQGTRWVQHRVNASKALLIGYEVIVTHMEHMAEDSSVPAADRAKVKGYLSKLKSTKFVLHLLLFVDLLTPVARLSLQLQDEAISLVQARACVLSLIQQLEVEAFSPQSVDLKKLLSDTADVISEANSDDGGKSTDDTVIFSGHKLSQIKLGYTFYNRHCAEYVAKVKSAVDERFSSLVELPVFTALKILDVKLWPHTTSSDLLEFGNAEVDLVFEHFKGLFAANKINKHDAVSQWQELKKFVAENMRHLPNEQIWCALHSNYLKSYEHILALTAALRVLPVSNASLERFFSTMKQVKGDWRNSLGEFVHYSPSPKFTVIYKSALN